MTQEQFNEMQRNSGLPAYQAAVEEFDSMLLARIVALEEVVGDPTDAAFAARLAAVEAKLAAAKAAL